MVPLDGRRSGRGGGVDEGGGFEGFEGVLVAK